MVSRVVENHARSLFYNMYRSLAKKLEQEERLQKQKFTEAELNVIKKIMEKNNNSADLDAELQEVLIGSDELHLEEQIGKGAYGEVFKAKYEGINVAVKVIRDINEDALEKSRAEILLMKDLHHPQIVMFIGACWDEFMMGIVLELVDNGPLANFLHNKNLHLSWEHPKLSMAKDAAAGCSYLHSSSYYNAKEQEWLECIVHRDLKPDNMLVTTTYGVKLTDFGEARAIDGSLTMTQVGSPVYMAPEVIRGEQYDEKIDIYSYAVTLLEMLVLADNIFEVFQKEYKRIKGEGNNLNMHTLTRMVALENFRPQLPGSAPKTLCALITDCWHPNPSSRPNFEEIMSRLDGEVHEEIFPPISEVEPSPKARARSRKDSIKNGQFHRGQRRSRQDMTFSVNSNGGSASSLASVYSARDSLKDDNSVSSQSTIASPVVGRNAHLRKMMSVKRVGNINKVAKAVAAGSEQITTFRGPSSVGPEVTSMAKELSQMRASQEEMTRKIDRLKKEAEESKKMAENAAAQLKLVQKNSRQARIDMNEKRKSSNQYEYGSDTADGYKLLSRRLVDNEIIQGREPEVTQRGNNVERIISD